jgi:hypothetical protein
MALTQEQQLARARMMAGEVCDLLMRRKATRAETVQVLALMVSRVREQVPSALDAITHAIQQADAKYRNTERADT